MAMTVHGSQLPENKFLSPPAHQTRVFRKRTVQVGQRRQGPGHVHADKELIPSCK